MRPRAFLGVEHSLSGRRWMGREAPADWVEAHRREGMSDLAARLLSARGAKPGDGPKILEPRLKDWLPDPSSLQDMDAAVEAILDVVARQGTIAILADYDVDGGTSGALVSRWLRAVGLAPRFYVPDRLTEGYGPSPQAFRRLKSEGADLVVTVDCGAAAYGPLEEAARIGLDVVVIDHHLMQGAPPPARAVVNPNRPDDTSGLGSLTAAGVAFVLLVGLTRAARARGLFDARPVPDLMGWLDLAALGTICDVAPLTGLNRAFVAQGLKVLGHKRNVGLTHLATVAGLKEPKSAYHAGFVLGPRLNAGGRIGDSSLAVRLLSTEDPIEAADLAAQLDLLNVERRAVEALVLEEAQILADKANPDDPCIVVGKPGWHPGVVGIVAGRLKERLHKPAIVLGSADLDDALAKGSGRSITGVDLGRAIAACVKDGLLDTGGGHAMAAGMALPFGKIDAFRDAIGDKLRAEANAVTDARDLVFDGALGLGAASIATIDEIAKVGPYGAGWPEPLFAFTDLRVTYASVAAGSHVRVVLSDNAGAQIRAIAFRAVDTPLGDALLARNAGPFAIAGKLKRDDWRGGDAVDLTIEDAALAHEPR